MNLPSMICACWLPSPTTANVPSYGSPFSSVMLAVGTDMMLVLTRMWSVVPAVCSTVGATRRPYRSCTMALMDRSMASSLEASTPNAASTSISTSSSIS